MVFDYGKLLFPYPEVRQYQDVLIQNINAAIESRKSLIAHAPTGLGKTVSALAPAITSAINHDLTVFFMTPRHTQHALIIDTIRDISKKHGVKLPVVDLISKQSMCPLTIANDFGRVDFIEYCKDLRDNGKCDYYKRTRGVDLTKKAEEVLNELIIKSPMHSTEFCNHCTNNGLCPYEMALELGKKSRVVVCDYFHLFSRDVRASFLAKMNKSLDESVVIIDEAHNLPDRIRSLMTYSLTTFTLNASIKELTLNSFDKEADYARVILRVLEGLVSRYEREGLVSKDDFTGEVARISGVSFDEVTSDLLAAGTAIREDKKKSYSLAVARFLDSWVNDDGDRVRVIKIDSSRRGSSFISLTYHCLNPAGYTEPVFKEAASTILMSGTLTPTNMYSEVLGLDASIIELKSPFPQENRLTLIVPDTTTRYNRRGDDEYLRIAVRVSGILNSANVSTAVFFPSYAILNRVLEKFRSLSDKPVIPEVPGLSKEDKDILLNKFKMNQGSVLFAVVSGSFGEGVDLPGSQLECIIIVGVPLPVPDLYTKSLINYYETRFKKGWDYGYIFPALTKVIQSAGRCIRQSTDRGVIILMDERYVWKNYFNCIPPEWFVKVTKEPEKFVKDFFN